MTTSIGVTTTGPLFVGGLPQRVLRAATRDFLQDTVETGERLVVGQLRSGHGWITGNYARSIVGEVGVAIGRGKPAKKVSGAYKSSSVSDIPRDSMHAVIYDSGVVYGPWLEGVGTRNQTTRFRGYHMFRRARTQLNSTARQRAEKHLRRHLRKLN